MRELSRVYAREARYDTMLMPVPRHMTRGIRAEARVDACGDAHDVVFSIDAAADAAALSLPALFTPITGAHAMLLPCCHFAAI